MIKAMVTLLAVAALSATVSGPTLAAHTASGAGTYFVTPRILSQFQFSLGSLQCKVAQEALEAKATDFQMFIFSTSITDCKTDTTDFRVLAVVEGEMASTTVLGRSRHHQVVTDVVSFEAVGEDADTPGVNDDFLSLAVEYEDVAGGQGPLFAGLGFESWSSGKCTITFEGTIESGNIRVHQKVS